MSDEIITNDSIEVDNDSDLMSFAYRDNELRFIDHLNGGIKTEIELFQDLNGNYGCFKAKEYCVTDGQDPNGNVTDKEYFITGNNRSLHIISGRHKSAKVADWWNKRYPASYNTFNTDFSALNFALSGDLRLNITGKRLNGEKAFVIIKDIGIAQTGLNGRNKWILGSKYETCSGWTLYYDIPYDIANTNNPESWDIKHTGKYLQLYLYRGDGVNNVYEVSVSAKIYDQIVKRN